MSSIVSWTLLFLLIPLMTPAGANDLAVVDQIGSDVLLFDREFSCHIGSWGDPNEGPGRITNSLGSLVFHPATGDLLLTNGFNGIQVFDADTGALVGTFGETAANLSRPLGMAFHPKTGNLFVVDNFNQDGSDFMNGDVREFNGTDGKFVNSFGMAQQYLSAPLDLVFQPVTGELLVSGNNPVTGEIGVWAQRQVIEKILVHLGLPIDPTIPVSAWAATGSPDALSVTRIE